MRRESLKFLLVFALTLASVARSELGSPPPSDSDSIAELEEDVAHALQNNPILQRAFFDPMFDRSQIAYQVFFDSNYSGLDIQHYLASPQFITVGKGKARATYRIEGLKDPVALKTILSLSPELQLRFLVKRQITLTTAANALNSQKMALGFWEVGQSKLEKGKQISGKIAGNVFNKFFHWQRPAEPAPPPPPNDVEPTAARSLAERGFSATQNALNQFNGLLCNRAPIMAGHNETGAVGQIGFVMHFKAGARDFYRGYHVGVSAGGFKDGKTAELFTAHAKKMSTSRKVIVRTTGMIRGGIYFRNRKSDILAANPETARSTYLPLVPGIRIYITDTPTSITIGLTGPLPGTNLLAKLGSLVGGAVNHYDQLKDWFHSDSVPKEISRAIPAQVHTEKTPLFRLTWAPGTKTPVRQGRILCPKALEEVSAPSGSTPPSSD